MIMVLMIFLMLFFLIEFFPPESTAARNVAKTAAVNAANNVANDARNLIKGISFENNAPFINCISKINGTLIGNAEDLDVAMPKYNLLDYSKNYRSIIGSLWSYQRDEPISDGRINHYLGSKSFDSKSSIAGELGDINDDNQVNKNNNRFAVSLKQLSNFRRSLKMPLINCETELILAWSKNCVILSNARRDAIAATELNAAYVSNLKPEVNF